MWDNGQELRNHAIESRALSKVDFESPILQRDWRRSVVYEEVLFLKRKYSGGLFVKVKVDYHNIIMIMQH